MIRNNFFVYIMASHSGTLYIGVTNDLQRRVFEHKQGVADSFTKKYQCTKLVYFEQYSDIEEAIRREKQLKGWKRIRKEELINKDNPHWEDLSNKFENNDN
ncbi:MAG: GIY-YIG nuclease family protein [Candidatus Magasanikbacteria bacterium]|nr:GIY-YIG nuclease family protein [Candidatus Magasanikbacteria bacterium]